MRNINKWFGVFVCLSILVTTAFVFGSGFEKNQRLNHRSVSMEHLFHPYLSGGSPLAAEMRKVKLNTLREQNGHAVAAHNFSKQKTGDELRLVPGGQSIGVKIKTRGVLVVGYHLINSNRGQASPGESAGIQIGDIITKINGRQMSSITDVRQIIDRASAQKKMQVDLIRRHTILKKQLMPVKGKDEGRFQIGLYIRDSASGIGTMTFYDPKSNAYGALGHTISDRDTGQPVPVKNGQIVRSMVQAIQRGAEGNPGEKIAFFPDHAQQIGTINRNTAFGIYGYLQNNDLMYQNRRMQALPVAKPDQVHEGAAQILTVLNGSRVEAFDVRILNAVSQKNPETKGIVIKITDPRLLQVTGGIIQGMSGSPIIQDGRLVGAVTHVFVNDPTCGYGVHIKWMLHEAGIQQSRITEESAS
ncbi:SpoIVB peptidase [Sporolactobacillus sp. THM19-2]|jgi:stage IV sporulation protein B|uniref:SpoIVB peptidase n=1 Tax=Sporolactobacillus sp. THM19-2 TaxID=2511171 RepID=UPI00101EF181|nr:SpoIVB peptidase [Sporolactobacillus sp. THM19-2]RYL87857.1 SpoIVB peptidase [Sporolactobacillus sp. THM19-2]